MMKAVPKIIIIYELTLYFLTETSTQMRVRIYKKNTKYKRL